MSRCKIDEWKIKEEKCFSKILSEIYESRNFLILFFPIHEKILENGLKEAFGG